MKTGAGEFAAGCRNFEVPEPSTGETIPLVVMYPGSGVETPARLGPYTINLAMDSSMAAGVFPLVVISHGTGGSPLVYRTLAAHLARHGMIVALPEHPRNNRNNNELAGTAAILANRPRHIRAVLDWVFASGEFGPGVLQGAASVIGHSLGGYTALAVAGGTPTAFSHERPDGRAHAVEVSSDERVKALVLLAPATPWYMAVGALKNVRVPILMMTGEKDSHTPSWHGEIVKLGVAEPALVSHVVVANAGHFAFLSPFPAEMTNPAFAPSQDPEGFDRQQFQLQLCSTVLAFLKRNG